MNIRLEAQQPEKLQKRLIVGLHAVPATKTISHSEYLKQGNKTGFDIVIKA